MGRPWLSVVMPTYNGARYVAAALTSIEREGTEGVEVIAVDDGSTDATPEILAHFQARLPLTVLRREHVGNWTVGTNRAMGLAVTWWALPAISFHLWRHSRSAEFVGGLF